MKTYFACTIKDSMFPETCALKKEPLSVSDVHHAILDGIIPSTHPWNKAIIDAMVTRYGKAFTLTFPENATPVFLTHGDAVIVMSVHGLPRLEGRHEYTPEEIESAVFKFSRYTVL